MTDLGRLLTFRNAIIRNLEKDGALIADVLSSWDGTSFSLFPFSVATKRTEVTITGCSAQVRYISLA